METEQLGLFGLPSRGIMGVVEGFKAMPAGPGPAYICCQQLSPKVIVRNPAVRLVDLYKLSARTKPASTTPAAAAPAATTAAASTTTAAAAAAGGSGSKRPAGQLQLEDRPGKRQQQQQPGQEHITAVPAARPQQQQQQAGAGAISGVRAGPHLQQQQQQRGTAPQPLTALPNATNIPTTTAAAAGSCTASKQLLRYTPEQMMLFSNKRLTELLKACGLKVAGKKDELVRRLMEYQRRVRKAAQASTAIPHARGARA